MSKARILALTGIAAGVFGVLVQALPAPRLAAQTDAEATAVQQTLDASVNALFTQTAQAIRATPDFTQTVDALFSAALTATAQATPSPQAAPLDLDALEVVGTRAFELFSGPGRTSSYLAPSGERFAHFDGRQICIYGTLGHFPACTALPGTFRYDTSSPRWSPDSRYLAFIDETPLVTFNDSDIWLLDTQAGTLGNLTDDGTTRVGLLRPLPAGERPGLIDIAPRFSADSQRVLFVRYEMVNQRLVGTLYSIGVDGGAPAALHTLTPNVREDGFVTVFDIGSDGETVVFNRQTGAADAVHLLSLATGETRLLYTLDHESERAVTALAFSPAGDAVLVQNASFQLFGADGSRELTPWHIVTLDGRKGPAALPPTPQSVVIGAGWSPDGTALVYLVRSAVTPEHAGLYAGAPGAPGRLLLPGPEGGQFLAPPSGYFDRLDWGANGVVLVTVAARETTTAVRLGVPG